MASSRANRRDSTPLWGLAVGGAGADWLFDVASDSTGNALVTGTVTGAVDVDRAGTVDLNAGVDGQAFVASVSPAGQWRWWRTSGGTGGAWGTTVATGVDDTVYIGGWYRNGAPDFDANGTLDLPPSPETKPEVMALRDPMKYEYDGYFGRLRSDGTPLWIKGVSGAGVQIVSSLAIAANGDLLVLGETAAPADVDGDGAPDLEFRSMADRIWKHHGDTNAFLMQVTPDGKPVWTKRYAAPAKHVAALGSRIVLSGAYSGALDVDDDGVPERTSDGDEEREGFSIVLDERGNVQQVLTVVGQHHDVVSAAGFALDGSALYLTGYTSLGADFDGDDDVEAASVCHKAGQIYFAVYELEAGE